MGLHVPRAGLTNRPAVIAAIDIKQGIYKVKYDNGDLDQWLPANFIGGCSGVVAAPITTSYFAGTWGLFVGPTPHYEKRGADKWLIVGTGARAYPLSILANGTYVWRTDSTTTVRGKWRAMRTDERSDSTTDPAIVVVRGESGSDWGCGGRTESAALTHATRSP